MSGSRRTNRTREQARDLSDRLRAEGRHQDAEIIQRLVRSSAAGSIANSVLWRYNQELRRQLEEGK